MGVFVSVCDPRSHLPGAEGMSLASVLSLKDQVRPDASSSLSCPAGFSGLVATATAAKGTDSTERIKKAGVRSGGPGLPQLGPMVGPPGRRPVC